MRARKSREAVLEVWMGQEAHREGWVGLGGLPEAPGGFGRPHPEGQEGE